MGGAAWSALTDLVLPRTCAGCGLPGPSLCRRCAALLARPHLATPRRFPEGFPPTVAAGAYDGAVRPAVLAFKERGRAELARPLGTALALAVAAVLAAVPGPPRQVLLVPVPSSAAALRERGRDHVRELAGRAVRELRAAGLPAAEARLLRRRGRVRDSAELSAGQRRANLAGTFALAPGAGAVEGRLVLVDDVVTSGATLTEAGSVLAALAGPGGPPVLAAVVAATPRQRRTGSADRLSGPRRSD
ncbi:Predicted amidophosphoribosyltransferases [Blastococcus aggregatus]|uniref:Predicted amidophosphoribosyltransferases n=1 Tax=Blastococcus aggregatus TaxID=38502 RepID=A0A285V454_9ACTN|nr:ComF family protein [Blastococcus aggregatus]SOC48892.1 Predicted amidophosphoribosyltransferases [Blastococcus aggregatus]